jgi:AraC-like DNA-binding protein
VYAGAGAGVPWARVAAELGYADQSHMIAEFRELSGLTPDALATGRWFHPFILEARSRSLGPRFAMLPGPSTFPRKR